MRLLYLTRTHTGHDARWLRTLASHGLQLGFLPLQPVDQGTFSLEHPDVDLLASPGLSVGAGTSRLNSVVQALGRQIHQWEPDAIMAGPLTDAGYLAARIAPERTLFTSWAFDVLHEAQVDAEAGERLQVSLASAEHLFTDCHSLRTRCEALANRTFRQTCVVPWGLGVADKPEPRRGWRKRLGDEAAKVVVSPRGFSPVHRPEIVVESFRQAYARDASLRLWLPGSGVRREETERQVEMFGLRAVVRFLGHLDQSDLAGCFTEADLYLAASSSDGSSISLLQAMHAGLPCVVSDLPANREWLSAEGGGYGHDAASFADQLSCFAQLTPSAREHIAVCNRSQVRARADLTANLPRLLDALHAVACGVESRAVV